MSAETLKGQYAGFISRLVAFGIDVVIITASLVALGWLVNAAMRLFGAQDLSQLEIIQRAAISGIAAIAYTAGYNIFFWSLASQTPGKILLGLIITTPDGRPISFGQSIRRYIGYIFSIAALWLGFLWILVDDRRQGWHDKFAGTVVVYSWDARAGSFLIRRIRERRGTEASPGQQDT